MLDAQSAEAEVLDFLKSFIVTVKPDVVLETGTFIGHSAMKMAEGMKANGFGKIITIEYDPSCSPKPSRISMPPAWAIGSSTAMLRAWIRLSKDIDILFSDSDLNIPGKRNTTVSSSNQDAGPGPRP